MHTQKSLHAPNFVALRARLNLTLPAMADYLGVPVYTYRKWETGEREPSSATLRLLDVLGTIEALAPSIHAALLPENRVMSKNPKPRRAGQRSPRDSAMSKNPQTLEVAQQ